MVTARGAVVRKGREPAGDAKRTGESDLPSGQSDWVPPVRDLSRRYDPHEERSFNAVGYSQGIYKYPAHREADAAYFDVLEDLKSRGWLQHAGVSCDHRPESAIRLLAGGDVAAVQLAGSVLDRRHRRAGVFKAAVARGVAVFVRSVYLQGLLLMPEESVPSALRAVVPGRRGLAALAASSGITLAELAVRYVLAQQGVTSVVVGAETEEQVRLNAAMAARGPLPADLVEAVDAVAVDLPVEVINPRLWGGSVR